MFWAPHWWAAAQPHWPSAKEAAGTTGREPSRDTSETWPAIIDAKSGFTPDPTAMNVDIGAIRTGRKAIVMAGIGRRNIAMAETGARAIVTAGIGQKATGMAGIGTGIEIIANTPDARRRIAAITGMAGITTGTRRTTA